MLRGLIVLGILLFLIAPFWPRIKKIPFGRLPGDISLRKGNVTYHFPIVTCILISATIGFVLRLFNL